MWIFDRTRTSYEESVDHFKEAVKRRSARLVYEEIARRLKVDLEAVTQSYATPIFQLGVGFRIRIGQFEFGKTLVSPQQADREDTEFRLTETAEWYDSGRIARETFFLLNVMRFQVLNSTLEDRKFIERQDYSVLPLLLTLQVLSQLESHGLEQAYLAEEELRWLYQKRDHNDVAGFVAELIQHRQSGDTPPPGSNTDAFRRLFACTGLVIERLKVPIPNRGRKPVLVLAADRAMVTQTLLDDPPPFIPMNSPAEKWRWAAAYVRVPERPERFFPPKHPVVLACRLPNSATFDPSQRLLTVPWTFGARYRKGNLLAFANPLPGLDGAAVYELEDEPAFPGNGQAILPLRLLWRSQILGVNLAQRIGAAPAHTSTHRSDPGWKAIQN